MIAKRMNKTYRVPLLYDGTGGGSLLPPELQACEYLKANGNSYIATNYILHDITFIKVSYILDNNVTLANASVFGSTSVPYLMIKNNFNQNHFVIYNGGGIDIEKTDNVNVTIFDDTGVYHNDIKILSQTLPQNNTDKFYLFCRLFNNKINTYGTGIKILECETNFFNMKSAYVKNGQTYQDNKGNTCNAGTPGMYDVLNQIFYTNDGTSYFTCGHDINI